MVCPGTDESSGVLDALSYVSPDVRVNDPDPPRPDVDGDWPHLVVRPTHLRDLDVTNSRVPRRDQIEVNDTVRDKLLDAVRVVRPAAPFLRDHQGRASVRTDDLPEQYVGEGQEIAYGLKRGCHRGEGVDDEALNLFLLDFPCNLFPQDREAFRSRSRELQEEEVFLR